MRCKGDLYNIEMINQFYCSECDERRYSDSSINDEISHIDTLSNTLHHHTKLKLSRCFGGTNTANIVHANGFPTNNFSASSSSSYLHLCRTPTFPWSSVFGDGMQFGFCIGRGSSLKGVGGMWALVPKVLALSMHLRFVHVCWIQVQGMIRWTSIWNGGCASVQPAAARTKSNVTVSFDQLIHYIVEQSGVRVFHQSRGLITLDSSYLTVDAFLGFRRQKWQRYHVDICQLWVNFQFY